MNNVGHTLTKSIGKKDTVIYFAGSIRAGRDDVSVYAEIISQLKAYGTVITEHVGDYKLSDGGQSFLTDKFIHDRDLQWLRQSNIVVAEVTTPSLGVGYEIATAIQWRIPVITLYRQGERAVSAMISGSDNCKHFEYSTISEAKDFVADVFSQIGLKVCHES
ncbi:nucleoside 2-deoxyribosyltransferase [Vibrio sp. 070316B]|uniref:nucleoside 2-deoxyribosyltransferase n=1 Tax=unclassified Vibrio TaxID=2614977 RepID=UPI0014938697|nr:nucleoside 2-deoxyribosyltransferase [Vibrio sp. 070316B]NOI37448.1 nucleoside 2-deoxyribosyltransferase [Vibrio sp. 070316B]